MDMYMTLFWLLATFTSPSCVMWDTKYFLIRFRS